MLLAHFTVTVSCKNRQKRSEVQGFGQMQLFQINRTMTMFAETVEASFTSVHNTAWSKFCCTAFRMGDLCFLKLIFKLH